MCIRDSYTSQSYKPTQRLAESGKTGPATVIISGIGLGTVSYTHLCADAVRFGGGMGNISRGGKTSGLPRYLEGARYAAQWSGFPDRKSTRLNSSHSDRSRMPSSA